jgi:mannose-1-phosphate guanylyltransferase/phosphomannomutase
MKAVIMAGGKGSRLRPLTCNKPKPMVPVLNKPVMEYAVELLKKHGITDIAVTLQYLPEVIKDYFGDGSRYGVNMQYFEETIPLGTAGSVKNAEDFLNETFLVISGDGITDYNLTQALDFHCQQGGIVTLVMAKVQNPLEYGVVMCDENSRIIRFLEKPSWGEVFSDTVNTGIYVIEPEIFSYYQKDVFFDFSKDLFPMLLADQKPMYGYVATGYWSDIGNLEQYRQTHNDLLDGLVKADIKGQQVEEGFWVGVGTEIPLGVKITEKPVYIGENCKIESGSEFGKYTVLGNNNTIYSGSSFKRSIMWDFNFIGNEVELRGATLCNHCQVQANSALFEGAVIGDGSFIGRRVTVKPQIKVWPNKVVADNSVLTTSLIWGEQHRKSLFSKMGVAGLANIEISPEMVVKLAVAHGSTIPQGSHVALSSDHHRASRVIKMAFASGLLAAGINVSDIGVTTTPITRYGVKSLQAKAGIHIRILPPNDSSKIIIEFLDENGINISKDTERKIENTYIQEDFRRANIRNLGEIKYVPQLVDAYREGLLKTINQDMVKRCRYRLLVAYDYKNLGWFIPPLFEKLGCQVTTINSIDYTFEDVMGLVRENQMDLGVFLNSNADDLILFTPAGDVICEENLMALWSLICLDRVGDKEIGVPVTASSVIEKIADQLGGRVVRTKSHPRALMEVSRENMFQPLFDGTFIFLKLLEYMQAKNKDLTAMVEAIPLTYLYKKEVECPWSEKGTVMRRLIEDAKNEKVELLDGVKIYFDDSWILVLPDSEEPVFRVISEASTFEAAEKLAERYAKKIDEYKSVV